MSQALSIKPTQQVIPTTLGCPSRGAAVVTCSTWTASSAGSRHAAHAHSATKNGSLPRLSASWQAAPWQWTNDYLRQQQPLRAAAHRLSATAAIIECSATQQCAACMFAACMFAACMFAADQLCLPGVLMRQHK